jgi:hypothetical protein
MGRPGAMWEGANVLGGARIRLAGRLMRDRHGLITTWLLEVHDSHRHDSTKSICLHVAVWTQHAFSLGGFYDWCKELGRVVDITAACLSSHHAAIPRHGN